MAVIVPTVTAEDSHTYRSQLELVMSFADRIHLDFMDGLFTKNASLELASAWMPEGKQVDLHLMYMRPDIYLDQILSFKPSLVIVHAEAEGDYERFAASLQKAEIQSGVALLQDTPVQLIEQSLELIDHVLIFSGNLGHFGGTVDLNLLDKARKLKELKPDLEIGWDGGVSTDNARQLIGGGIDVLNVGGAIQNSDDPEDAYNQLRNAIKIS